MNGKTSSPSLYLSQSYQDAWDDYTYTDDPAIVMALTESDVKKGMRKPIIWDDYQSAVGHLTEVERFELYKRAKNAYAVIATGEERQYANLLLVKGVVLPEEEKN